MAAVCAALLLQVSGGAASNGPADEPMLTASAASSQEPVARGRGRGAQPETGPRLKALVVSGGCCHDYPLQARIIMDAISKAVPVDWMVAVQGGRGTKGHLPVYDNPDWAKGYDIVVHNECFADIADQALIKRITDAHKTGIPAVVIHCAMHTFRASTADDWREFLGVTTRRHTRQFNIPVKVAGGDHALKGFKEDWVTPSDELYVIDKFWPNAKALASAVSPEDQKEYPLAWTNDYHGARVFGTTLGHGNATFEDPGFQDLLARGFKWAAKRE
jgi:type 1 glutamine amidotransferase